MRTLAIAILASLVCACGSKDSGDKPADKHVSDGPSQVSKPHDAMAFPLSGVPVETFLADFSHVPMRLAATELTLSFRSNVQPAVFECRTDRQQVFRRCGGDHYHFASLVNGRSYEIEIRARDSDGRVDLSPLHISFLVDQAFGLATQQVLPAEFSARDLPPHVAASEMRSDKSKVDRTLAVGSYFGVVAPFDMAPTSFSTSKTYRGDLKIFHKLGEHGGSVYKGLTCDRGYDRETTTPFGSSYCEAVPNASQFDRDFAPRMPRNHVELVAGALPTTDQKLFVAAFDAEADPARGHLGIDDTCGSASEQGSSVMPLWRDYYQRERTAHVEWCRVQDHAGKYWWVAAANAYASESGVGPYLRVIYTVAADRGILSRTQFLQQAADFMKQVIVSTSPADK